MEDFKGNSSGMQNTGGDPSRKKQIANNVIVKKQNDPTKVTKKFFAEDAKTVGAHVVDSIVIPSAQKLLSDIVKGAIDWLIYGKNGSQTRTGSGTISYGSYYNRSGLVNTTPISYGQPILNKPTLYNVQEVIIPDRGEAEDVLINMREAIDTYGMVSVGDFYDLVGIKASYTDQKWGWFDLKSTDILQVNGGYVIRFPKIQAIER